MSLHELSERIKSIRMSQGLTRIELAQKAGVAQRIIHYIENEIPNIWVTEAIIERLATALGVKLSDLMDESLTRATGE